MVAALDRPWWARYRCKLEEGFGHQELIVRAAEVEQL
jgi:hypothetical protein